ncbi:hypothetical protein UVI_02062540 [Ustilaginoidea virens]|uniref:Major facilitator superfamily (MFS) profile domain-containing protein n=1 Tax=Ustilaginoidea virens TaxID=1159556 RepID=A0A1B5L6R0_USTVR|nr:hypothetical protein UVI_02062540 [Ustilaginoidea virens]
MARRPEQDGPVSESTQDPSTTDAGKEFQIPLTRFWTLCAGVCLGLFLAMIDTSIVATSLYNIGSEFNDVGNVNWVALSYTLAYMGFAVVFARISDIVGRRDAFVVASVLFVAFSLACGWAQKMHQLIAFRTVQGIGGSGLYSLAMIMLPEMSPNHLKQYIGAMVGVVIVMAGVLGPILGGLLTNYTTWRWVFWINGPVGALSLATFLSSWPVREQRPRLQKHSWKQLDLVGSFLTIAATVLVVFAFQDAGVTSGGSSSWQGNNWQSAVFVAPLVAGTLCWVALVAWESMVERRLASRCSPVFPMRLFQHSTYTSGVVNTLLLGFPYLLLIYVVPLRIQVVGGKSALLAGVMLLPMLVTVALGSIVSGAVNSRKQLIMETLVAGSCLMLLGCGVLTTLSVEGLDAAKLMGFLTFCGLGFGLAISSSTMIASLEIAPKDYGTLPQTMPALSSYVAMMPANASAQGIVAQMRMFGGSLGIAASTAILRAGMDGIPSRMSKRQTQTMAEQQNARLRYAEAFRTDMIVATAMREKRA